MKSADTTNNAAAAQTPPQKAGGDAAVQATEEAHNPHAIGFRRWINRGGFFFTVALIYALVFAVSEGWFPQVYRAWLDFCAPLAEYVGGLTPRAGRIAGELVEGGYPERADDAIHGIAIARVMLVPSYVCLLMAFFCVMKTLPGKTIPASRLTRKKAWSVSFLVLASAIAAVYAWEFKFGEDFVRTHQGWVDDYHRGNYAMMMEVVISFVSPVFILFSVGLFFAVCTARFSASVQHPGDKS